MPKCTNCNKSKPPSHFKRRRPTKNSHKPTKHCSCCRDKYKKHRESKHSKIYKCKQFWEEWKKTHPCVDCGCDDHRLIQADHRLPTDKTHRLGHYTWWACHGGVEAMALEVKKVVSRCIRCHRIKTFDEKYYLTVNDNISDKKYTIMARERRIKIRKHVNEQKMDIGECLHCGIAVTPNTTIAFDFDHIHPKAKDYGICKLINSGYSMKVIQNEIKKCMLLCCSCHHLKTNYGLKVGYISKDETNKMQVQQEIPAEETTQEQETQNEQKVEEEMQPDEPELLHERFYSLSDQGITQPEQRSPEWFEARKGKLTGSKLSQFLFIKTHAERVELFEQVWEGRRRAPFTEEQQGWVKWGCDYEDHALKVLLDNLPTMNAFEAPMVQHSSCKWIASSPDGFYELTDAIGNVFEKGCIEIKCPGKKRKANTKPTYYYVMQMYLEMACSGHDKVIFCSWGPDACRAWKMHWDDNLWNLLCQMMQDLKNTKTDQALSWEDWTLLQYRLKSACHNACNEATPLFEGNGWDAQYTKNEN